MGPRTWAAIGNLLKISAAIGYMAAAAIGARAVELNQQGAPSHLVIEATAVGIVMFVLSIILWNLKGPLVRGNLIVRVLVGPYMALWMVSTLGFGLIVFLVVYLFTGEPASYDLVGKGKAPKPKFKAPANWQPTGRVGPSGAMLYADAGRSAASGIFDSFTPVQVVDKQGGVARVVSATGEGGWIDQRTLTEGV